VNWEGFSIEGEGEWIQKGFLFCFGKGQTIAKLPFAKALAPIEKEGEWIGKGFLFCFTIFEHNPF